MILLIDADSLLYMKDQNELEDAIETLDSKIRNIIIESRVDEFILILTSYDNYRKEVNTEYKANRKDKEKPTHIKELRQYMVDTYETLELKGFEADDLVASIYRSDMDKYKIASVDKDILMNLPGKHFNLHYKKMCYNEYISLCEANNNFCVQLLTGDKTDNIPSITLNNKLLKKYKLNKVKGVGPATAKKIIEVGTSDFGYTPLEVVMDAFRLTGEDFMKQYKQVSIGMFNNNPKFKTNTLDTNYEFDLNDTYSGDFLMDRGKYKGRKVSWIHLHDKQYFNWAYENIDVFQKKCMDNCFQLIT